MRVATAEDTQKIRRKASDALLAYDMTTGAPIGQIVDLSGRGMKLFGEIQMTVNRVYYFRIPLIAKIKGRSEVIVDADCRWCNVCEDTGWYYSGYSLRFPSPKDGDIIQKLIHSWMVDHISKFNGSHTVSMKKNWMRSINAVLNRDLMRKR